MEQHQHYQSLQDQAYNALRSKIIYAELKPGTRLSAIGLEKETGIGRTPIRESFVAPARAGAGGNASQKRHLCLKNQHGARRERLFLAREAREKRAY